MIEQGSRVVLIGPIHYADCSGLSTSQRKGILWVQLFRTLQNNLTEN